MLSRSSKSLNESIKNTWKMENTNAMLQHERCSRMELLQEAFHQGCVKICDKIWLKSAVELLTQNHIHTFVHAAAVREQLSKGRETFCNLMLIGSTNCGKMFMMKPLEEIYNSFLNPSNYK